MTLQEQLITTKKNHILNAAARTFAEKGYHATSIKDVARAAGVADGTIYNHFQNKYALLLGLFTQMTGAAQPAALPAEFLSLDLRTLLRAFIAAPLHALQGHDYELLRVVLSEALVNRELAEAFRTDLLAPMVSGAIDVLRQRGELQAEPEVTARLLSSLVLGLLVQAALGDDTLQDHWNALPDTLADLLTRGLA